MNILIFDENETIAYVLKAILTSQKHRVSISTNFIEARAKLNTALFDTVFFAPSKNSRQLIKYAQDDLPFLPLILIEGERQVIEVPSIIGKLDSPLKLADVNRTLKRAKSYLSNYGKTSTKKSLQLQIDISRGESIVKCRSLNITPRAILVEGSDTPQFYSFFTNNANELLETNIGYNETEMLRIPSKIAFFDFYPSQIIKNVGLEFADINQEQKEIISKILMS